MLEYIFLAVASAVGGGVDAIVGGGGLVVLPALFIAIPQAEAAWVVGTSKSAGIWGTGVAARRFLKKVTLPRATLVVTSAAALCGPAAGAVMLLAIPVEPLRVALPFILAGLLCATIGQGDIGDKHRPRFAARSEQKRGVLLGFVIGMYDGFFGPGTGSFFIFGFVRWLGYDFLHPQRLRRFSTP